MQKRFEVSGVQYLAVEVPASGRAFKVLPYNKLQCIGDFWLHGQQHEMTTDYWTADLPEGSWEIVGLVKELTSFEFDPEGFNHELCNEQNLSENTLILKQL